MERIASLPSGLSLVKSSSSESVDPFDAFAKDVLRNYDCVIRKFRRGVN